MSEAEVSVSIAGWKEIQPSKREGVPSKEGSMSRIPVLDGWRGVAIALVIAHHVGQNLTASEAVYTQDVTRFGQFGVDIFFGLSGLLITRLLLQEHSAGGSFCLPQFYIRRTFRILPPLLAYVAVYTALGLWK